MKMPIMQAGKQIGKMFGSSGGGSGMDKVPTMSGTQKKALKHGYHAIDWGAMDIANNPAYKSAMQFTMDMLNPSSEAYQKFEAPYLTEFRQQIVPEIAERFAGLGAMSSSGMQQSLGSASSNLMERLAAMKTQGMMGSTQNAMNLASLPANMGMNLMGQVMGAQPFALQPQAPSMMQNLMGGLGQALPYLGMAAMGL